MPYDYDPDPDAPTWDDLQNSTLSTAADDDLAERLTTEIAEDADAWAQALGDLDNPEQRRFIRDRVAKLRADVADDLAERYHDERRTEFWTRRMYGRTA
jgi:hypothetical protein